MLEGKVVIVTGCAQGIGRYAASTFAREKAKLALLDVKPLDSVQAELSEMGVEVLTVKADVRDEGQVRSAMEQVASRFGQIDVLVNNAAIVTHFLWGIPPWPRIRDMESSFWDRVIGTNLRGTFLCTKYVLPHMEQQRSGHVINLYGGGGLGSTACAYVVSKEAIRYFTRFVAEEEREFNIRVVIVNPGAAIATEAAPEEARQRMAGPSFVEDRFVLAAQVDMEYSGKLLNMKDGQLVAEE